MNITGVDLNLLVAFDALMRERNVTRAGARIGLLQPSMSHALKRLRALCDDPLFVRTRTGMEPTPYAERLAEHVRQGLAVLEQGLQKSASFDAAQAQRTFVVLMSDIGEYVYLPRLMHRLRRDAPGIDLKVLALPRERYAEVLESGEADLAVGFLPALQSGFHTQRLFDDSYVCLARGDHPRIGRRLGVADFVREAHVVIEPAGSAGSASARHSSTTTLFERVLARQRLQRRIALRVPHFMVVPPLVQTTDLIAVVPSYVMSATSAMRNVKALPLPFEVPRFEIAQFWHQRQHADPANRWLRRLVSELITARR